MGDFNDAPTGADRKGGVLDKSNSTYGDINDIDGTQPYYWYQGYGSGTGGHISTRVTHYTIPVTFNGESVTHT